MKKTLLFLIALISATCVQAQTVWSLPHLRQVKQRLGEPVYHEAYQSLIRIADRDLKQEPLSVMQKEVTPPSGNKHDYTSLSRYSWPNPKTKNGLPYIMRDGVSNPELDKYDRNKLGDTADRIARLSLAWFFSGDEKYAAKATQLTRVWFLDKKTLMNPHMRYAQCVPGVTSGRCYGVLDALSFVSMLDGIQLLEKSESFTDADSKALKKWFGSFLKWLTTDKMALEESYGDNNHSIVYDLQVAAYAKYVGDSVIFNRLLNQFPKRRIERQIKPDGKQPHELSRTLAFGYSAYNILHIIDMMQIAKNAGLDWHSYGISGEHSLLKAIDFLKPYLLNPKAWPYQQISLWDEKRQEMAENCYRAWLLEPIREDYRQAYYQVRSQRGEAIFTLLYLQPTDFDNIVAQVGEQLSFADECTKKVLSTDNSKDNFTPITVKPDGSMRLGGPRDWRSGFFAGELWQMYSITRNPKWRRLAEEYTRPIESVKDYRGTHDLGFMVNDSWGKQLALTGDTAARSVVVAASKSLISRFNPRVGCIRSWDFSRDKWKFPVIIDNMMNLEMLFDATRLTGDSTYWKVAVSHANTTMKNHFRSDYSSYHVIDYDPETGAVRRRNTAQGYSDDSYWSRGQAWGLYGFTMCYRYTRDSRYLNQARHIFAFLRSLDNVPADGIFFWDQKDPKIPNVPRDASAAAIVASALYELQHYVSTDEATVCRSYADKIMNSLTEHYRAKVGTSQGFLLLHSTGHLPANSEVDVPLNYADYYYLEALIRSSKSSN